MYEQVNQRVKECRLSHFHQPSNANPDHRGLQCLSSSSAVPVDDQSRHRVITVMQRSSLWQAMKDGTTALSGRDYKAEGRPALGTPRERALLRACIGLWAMPLSISGKDIVGIHQQVCPPCCHDWCITRRNCARWSLRCTSNSSCCASTERALCDSGGL